MWSNDDKLAKTSRNEFFIVSPKQCHKVDDELPRVRLGCLQSMLRQPQQVGGKLGLREVRGRQVSMWCVPSFALIARSHSSC